MNRLNNILCPVDFSEASYQAIEKASFFAQLFQADLTLLHVISVLPKSFGVVFGLDLNTRDMVDKATENARTLLREAKKNYVPYAVKCKSSIRVGNLAGQVIEEAAAIKADLLVITLQESARQDSAVDDSHLSQILREVSCPVITFRASKPSGLEARKGFKKIVIPVQRKANLAAIKDYINNYLSFMGPEIVLISVLPPDAPELRVQEYSLYLQETAKEWADEGLGKVTRALRQHANPVREVHQFAVSQGCDLLLLPPGKIFDENVTSPTSGNSTIISQAPLPVMVFRSAMATPS
ncbi:MAG: universal stress protein [Bacteroidia bacterium]|nr:universal stress protein [Bacteroidia bacterium]